MITNEQRAEYITEQNKLLHGNDFAEVMHFEITEGIHTKEQHDAEIELFYHEGRVN